VKRVFPQLALLILLAARSASAHPAWGILVDPQGRVVFSEVTTNSVWRVEKDGGLVRLVTGRHSHDLFQDGQGALHGEHVVYDQARWLRSTWRLDPSGRFETPSVPAVDVVRAQRMSAARRCERPHLGTGGRALGDGRTGRAPDSGRRPA